MPEDIHANRERLKDITNSLIETITSPVVIENMRKFRDRAREGAGFAEAGDLMSLETLRAAGAKLPPDFRITSRVFEDRETGLRLQIDPPRDANAPQRLQARDAVSGCAGGGAGTVCGCAGGG